MYHISYQRTPARSSTRAVRDDRGGAADPSRAKPKGRMAALLARQVDEFTERSFCVPIPLNKRLSILPLERGRCILPYVGM